MKQFQNIKEIREFFISLPDVKTKEYENTLGEFGYAVFKNNKIGDIISLSKKIDISSVKKIILASDGYPKIFDSLEESEKYLNNLIKEDPLLIKKFLSTKGVMKNHVSFDDRIYLKII